MLLLSFEGGNDKRGKIKVKEEGKNGERGRGAYKPNAPGDLWVRSNSREIWALLGGEASGPTANSRPRVIDSGLILL